MTNYNQVPQPNQPSQPYTQVPTPNGIPAPVPQPQQTYQQPQYAATAQPQYQQQYAQPTYAQPQYTAPASSIAPGATYAMSDSDKTLRLIAFIFNIVGLVGLGWMLIPLAWGIPMTIRSWGIYKGTKPNTTAYAICDLLFLSMISGIILLINQKDA